jgi:hypothetical protein
MMDNHTDDDEDLNFATGLNAKTNNDGRDRSK